MKSGWEDEECVSFSQELWPAYICWNVSLDFTFEATSWSKGGIYHRPTIGEKRRGYWRDGRESLSAESRWTASGPVFRRAGTKRREGLRPAAHIKLPGKV